VVWASCTQDRGSEASWAPAILCELYAAKVYGQPVLKADVLWLVSGAPCATYVAADGLEHGVDFGGSEHVWWVADWEDTLDVKHLYAGEFELPSRRVDGSAEEESNYAVLPITRRHRPSEAASRRRFHRDQQLDTFDVGRRPAATRQGDPSCGQELREQVGSSGSHLAHLCTHVTALQAANQKPLKGGRRNPRFWPAEHH
jgi:hypothetical protein